MFDVKVLSYPADCVSLCVSLCVFEEHNQLLIVELMGSEPLEGLHVSLI